ncbi:MAG: HAMP domain-containing methyl-accepting chemotaxis protein [Rickettsiales bacterium]
MPSFRISHRLMAVIVAFMIPLWVLFYFVIDGINTNIRFSTLEVEGNAFQKPLEKLLENVSALHIAISRQDSNADKLIGVIDEGFADLAKTDAEFGEELQFTDDGLKMRGRDHLKPSVVQAKWEAMKKSLDANADANGALLSLIADIRGMIAHAGDTSNLILDPDLDSYYTMDVTLLALPQTQDRINAILTSLHPILSRGTELSREERLQIGIYASMLKEADMSRVQASLDTAFKEDANFYDKSETLEKNIRPALDNYTKANTALIDMLDHIANTGAIPAINDFSTVAENARETSYALWDTAANELDVLLKTRIQDYDNYKTRVLGLTSAAIVAALFLFFLITRGIVRPIKALQHAMHELAEGKLDTEVPSLAKKDEIGDMAKAVQYFKETAIRAKEMDEADKKETARKAARQSKIESMILSFEQHTKSALKQVEDSADELCRTAENMATVVADASQKTGNVSSASGQTLVNVQTVASAAEEMSASVNEISRQVSRTTEVMRDAVSCTGRADNSIAQFAEASDSISNIAQLIEEIASQINLLALNATIESARAGEAGKGFAVVANEVKALAGQTHKATEEIRKQISHLQGMSMDVIDVLKTIKDAITKANEFSSNIAAAIEEQTAVTNEIAGNMQMAARGVEDINHNIVTVSESSEIASQSTTKVLSSAKHLFKQSESLNEEINLFLKDIQVA